MTLPLFPDLVGTRRVPIPNFRTVEIPLAEQHAARYRKWRLPRWTFDLAYDPPQLAPADAQLISDHVLACAGAGLYFDWIDWRREFWVWVPMVTGDGSSGPYDLPGVLTAQHQFFYGAGSALDFTISPGVGVNGRDQVTFVGTSLTTGTPVWGNFSARRVFTVRFEDDKQPLPRHLDTGYYSFQTRILEPK